MSPQRKRFLVHDDSLVHGIPFKDGKTYRTNGRFLSTTDAAPRTADGLLTPPSAEEWAGYFAQRHKVDLGRVWDGMFAALGTLSAEDRQIALDAMAQILDSYGYVQGAPTSEMGAGPHGSFATGGQNARPEKEFGSTTDAQSINAANKRFWTDRKVVAPVPRGDATAQLCADINARNREFYALQPTRLGREFGKG